MSTCERKIEIKSFKYKLCDTKTKPFTELFKSMSEIMTKNWRYLIFDIVDVTCEWEYVIYRLRVVILKALAILAG